MRNRYKWLFVKLNPNNFFCPDFIRLSVPSWHGDFIQQRDNKAFFRISPPYLQTCYRISPLLYTMYAQAFIQYRRAGCARCKNFVRVRLRAFRRLNSVGRKLYRGFVAELLFSEFSLFYSKVSPAGNARKMFLHRTQPARLYSSIYMGIHLRTLKGIIPP